MRKAVYSLLILIFLSSFVSAYTESEDLFRIEAKGAGVYVDRTKMFHFGNVSSYPTNEVHYLLKFDTDAWAGGYEIILGTKKLNSIYFEASFEQYGMSFKDVKTNLPSYDGVGELTLMGYIDNAYGTGIAIAAGDGDENHTGTVTLKYELNHYSIRLNALRDILDDNKFALSLFAGPVYSRFSQYYGISTQGENMSGDGCSSYTSEKLNDYLFGGNLGLKGGMRLFKNCRIDISETFDLFYYHSRLKARQDFNSCLIDDGIALADVDGSIDMRDVYNGFVPHFASNIDITYDITKNVSISMFYQFDYWARLAHIVNPVVSGQLLSQNGSIHIAAEEDILSHAIGGSVSVRF